MSRWHGRRNSRLRILTGTKRRGLRRYTFSVTSRFCRKLNANTNVGQTENVPQFVAADGTGHGKLVSGSRKTVGMPIAHAHRSGTSHHLMDCRVIREGGSYRLAQSSAQVKFSLLPLGTLTDEDNQLYTPYNDGLWLQQVPIPEDGRSWMGVPDTMHTKAMGSGLIFCMPGRRVELKGVIVPQAGAGLVLPENIAPLGEFFDLDYQPTGGAPTPFSLSTQVVTSGRSCIKTGSLSHLIPPLLSQPSMPERY